MPLRVRLAVAALIGAALLFGLLAVGVLHGGPLVVLDGRVAVWLHAHRVPAMTAFMLLITHTHSVFSILVYAVIAGILLAARRQWYWLLTLVLVVPVGQLLNVLLKLAFQRVRPAFDDPLLTLTTYSFPSGHTASATLFYGFAVAYVLSRVHSAPWRVSSVLCAIVLVILVALSRIYLGVHYLSDVLAAVAWSLVWLGLSLAIVQILVARNRSSAQ